MCNSQRIRVVVASTHASERLGLTVMIDSQDDMEVVAQAGSGTSVLDLLSTHVPDIALIDATLVDDEVAGGFGTLRKIHPDCRLLVLAMYVSDESVQRALIAGADGYLLKGIPCRELIAGIRNVHAGHRTNRRATNND